MELSIICLILSIPGAFMVASRHMERRKYGFMCILTASLLQAYLMLLAAMPFLVLSSLVFSVSAVVGLLNNWSWRFK
jgi:hypothetical protein